MPNKDEAGLNKTGAEFSGESPPHIEPKNRINSKHVGQSIIYKKAPKSNRLK